VILWEEQVLLRSCCKSDIMWGTSVTKEHVWLLYARNKSCWGACVTVVWEAQVSLRSMCDCWMRGTSLAEDHVWLLYERHKNHYEVHERYDWYYERYRYYYSRYNWYYERWKYYNERHKSCWRASVGDMRNWVSRVSGFGQMELLEMMDKWSY
jgi:hypothetical protein